MTQASSCTGNGNSLANAVFQLLKSFVDCHTLSLFNWDPARLIYMFETYRAKNKGTKRVPESLELERDQLWAQ